MGERAMSVFLSVEEDLPLGIFIGDNTGMRVVPLDEFFKESLIGMSEEQCKRYAGAFERFVTQLIEADNGT